jgi:hypothetical protein
VIGSYFYLPVKVDLDLFRGEALDVDDLIATLYNFSPSSLTA